jgi:Membrane-associated phospholipid phosphatase
MLQSLINLDIKLFLFLNHTIANPVCDFIFIHITNGVFWIVPGIIAAALFVIFQKKKALIILGLVAITVGVSDPVCNRLIKPNVERMRPCNPSVHLENGRFLLGRKTSRSFPSSHAMNIFAQAMLLSLFYRKKTAWFFLFALVIGFSRIYVGVHYPFDVAAGGLFGMVIGAAVFGGYRAVLVMLENRREEIPDRPS